MIGGALLKALKYAGSLGTVGKLTGRLPSLNTAVKIAKNPVMSRKEFLRMSKSTADEMGLQSRFLMAADKIEENRSFATFMLNRNQSIVDKIALLNKKVDAGLKVSQSQRILNKAKQLSKNKGEVRRGKKHLIESEINEFMMEPEGAQLGIKAVRKIITNQVNNTPKSQLIKDLARMLSSHPKTSVITKLQSKHMKKLGLTSDDLSMIQKYKTLKFQGVKGFNDPLLDEFHTAREAYAKATGMSHYEIQSMISRGKGYYSKPGFKGKDVPKEIKEETGGLTDAWKELKREFKAGLEGD
jgi:hypothetical protein